MSLSWHFTSMLLSKPALHHCTQVLRTGLILQVNVTRGTHLLDDGGEPAQSEPVAVLPGDDGAAHLDDDPPGVLQLVPVEDGARALRRLEVEVILAKSANDNSAND